MLDSNLGSGFRVSGIYWPIEQNMEHELETGLHGLWRHAM